MGGGGASPRITSASTPTSALAFYSFQSPRKPHFFGVWVARQPFLKKKKDIARNFQVMPTAYYFRGEKSLESYAQISL
jgi:hypothetical protein